MNLNAIVGPVTAAVNPRILAKWQASNGYVTGANGIQKPQYLPARDILIQDQALSGRELAHLDSLGIQGILRALYVNDVVEGIDRATGKGGDLFTFKGKVWLVVQVLEPFSDSAGWTKIAVCQQLPAR